MKLNPTRKTGLWLAGVYVLMLSLSFAAVPFYSWFCKVTGYGGVPIIAENGASEVLDQTIRIRFDASKEPSMPWEFKPVVNTMTVRLGETGMAFYEAYNPTDRVVAGTAAYNVTPDAAGGYFNKIACFCFEQQVLQPGERVQMPVTFFVDPAILQDSEGKHVPEITLSYTFYETELPAKQAALAPAAATPVN